MVQDALYYIPGNPVALARPRFGNRLVWDAQKRIKEAASLMLLSQHGKRPKYTGPLHLDIIFYMPIPISYSKKKIAATLGSYHIARPDADNLLKFFLDVANNVLYDDDAVVASFSVQKIYSDNPRTECIVRKLA